LVFASTVREAEKFVTKQGGGLKPWAPSGHSQEWLPNERQLNWRQKE
jgi:hypothetical protein